MPNWWFTSDEHYGHRNAMTGWEGQKGNATPRPWTTLEDMTEGLVQRHNELVRPGDLVYHNGDMFWRTFTVDKALEVMGRLNGQHYYVFGNHEELIRKHESIRSRFVWLKERAKVKPRKGITIVLDHYAGRVWDGSHSGSYQLYGHSHGAIPNFGRSMDVGVDTNNFYPVSLDQVVEKLQNENTELLT